MPSQAGTWEGDDGNTDPKKGYFKDCHTCLWYRQGRNPD